MTKIKIKQLLRLAEKLKDLDATTARHLKMLAEGAMSRNHKVKAVKVSKSFVKAIQTINEKLDIPHALVGGLAVSYWVPNRPTDDLDVVVMTDSPSELKKVFPGKMGSLVYVTEIEGVDVDFLLAQDWDWSEEAIATAVVKKFGKASFKVVRPEFLVMYKFESSRERDIDDIKRLLKLDGIPEACRQLFIEHLPESLEYFDQLVAEAQLGL